MKPSSLCLNLSDITIWSTFIKSKLIGYLDLWNSFLLTTILSNFSVFSLILILNKNKTHVFCNAFLLYWIRSWYLFLWYSLILSFFFFRLVFVSIFLLLFYCFFVFKIIFSSFFFRKSFFYFLQDFLSVKLVITHFYVLICWVNKKNLFQLIHNPNAIKFV